MHATGCQLTVPPQGWHVVQQVVNECSRHWIHRYSSSGSLLVPAIATLSRNQMASVLTFDRTGRLHGALLQWLREDGVCPKMRRLPIGCTVRLTVCAEMPQMVNIAHQWSSHQVPHRILDEPVAGFQVLHHFSGGAHIVISSHQVSMLLRSIHRVWHGRPCGLGSAVLSTRWGGPDDVRGGNLVA